MSTLVIDHNNKTAKVGFDIKQNLNESKLYATTNQFGFAVDISANKTYGYDSYFKIYQIKNGRFVKKNGLFIASRVLYTAPVYFTHSNERDATILWDFSSKEKRLIFDILNAPITSTFNPVKGFDAGYIVNSNITTYQFLIFVLDKLIKNTNGFTHPTDEEIVNSSIHTTTVSSYFIPIDYPMPDYKNMTLRK